MTCQCPQCTGELYPQYYEQLNMQQYPQPREKDEEKSED